MEELVTQLIGYLRGMWRFRWWGLALAWVVGIAGSLTVYLMPDHYESSARIHVDTQSVLRPLMSGLAVQPNIGQQIDLLSRTLISRPNVEKLITMADLDLTVQSAEQREALITSVTSRLRIQSGRGDNLFTLSYNDTLPARAQRVVQSLLSLFVESGLGGKRQDTDAARRFIEEQIRSYELKLSEAENRLKDFRLRNMALLGTGTRDYVTQIAETGEQLRAARLELREAEDSRDAMRQQLAAGPTDPGLAPPPVAATPEIDARIDALKRNLDEMLQRYTDLHPDVVGARRVIEDLEKQKQARIAEVQATPGAEVFGGFGANAGVEQTRLAVAQAEARVASLRARVTEFEARVARLTEDAQRIPELETEMAQLNRDYSVHKSNYDQLVSRRESANMAVEMSTQSGIADFRIIDPPTMPTKPSAPNRLLLLPLAALAGLVAGFALTFLVSQLRPAFSDARQLREITGLPVLGTVSMLSSSERRSRRRNGLLAFGSGLVAYAGVFAAVTVAIMVLQY
ncbi:XrtA system polysaccharide chain length determinant [Thauera sp.]|jgi:polysaccharide chain length determinant protein (PEP-CTERM system associated)|uniref:XrtA system polysaccharide chain length determinant n=1 Tax=Thauera sp. TaxID=1905334 RepID=UPI00260F0CDB|nr:XrtA system polysaccharide chain length determinant [Thauera sp.]